MSSITLTVPQPCPESWEAMTPTSAGRHCAACQKVVVDFTQQTDAEVLAYFRQATRADTCGRLRAGQLGRPLQPVAATASRWRSWLGAALALGGALGSGRAVAQSSANFHPGPVPEVTSSPAISEPSTRPKPVGTPAGPPPSAAGGPLVLRGVITDSLTGEALPGVTILLKGTQHGTNTDAQGAFSLPIGSEEASGTLVIAYIGYVGIELPVAGAPAQLAVRLAASRVFFMGDVVITNAGPKPYPWHPRALYRWGRYWLTRPFWR